MWLETNEAVHVIKKKKRPEWLDELGSWITYQLIQAYHQYGVGSHPAL